MKRKVFSLMMTLVLAFMGVARANELTVNDGTTTNGYVPVYGFYADAYLKCEFVQPAADLADMNGGTINGMTFYASQSSVSWGSANFQVFMTEVGNATIGAFTGPDAATVVYEGALSISGGEMAVTFTTPYTYQGGNLLVGVYNTVTGSYVTSSWYGVSATGASVQGYSYSSLGAVSPSQRNFLPKTTFSYTGGNGGGTGDKLHVKYIADGEEVIDVLNMGVRPVGAWMEPFTFTMYSDGPTYTVAVLDFTPDDGLFEVSGEEPPFQVTRTDDVELTLASTGTQAGVIERQFVAITEGDRAAHIWPVSVELYAPECPDVWEVAANVTSYPYVNVPATMTNLHNDYTLPFPEIPEGNDAVYKLTIEGDQMLNASVTYGENGKVALYTQNFNGEGGPMATNNYTGLGMGGGSVGGPFEAQIGEGTNTSGYLPFYCYYNYSLSQQLFAVAELEEAGVTTAPMTSLSWQCSATNNNLQSNITIWMANVEETAVNAASPLTSTMTKVYEGNMTPIVGWNEFVFNQGNFAWDGHSNILICVQRNNGAWASGVSWYVGTQNFTAAAYKYSDTEGPYDMTTTSYSMTTTTSRANIIMKANGRSRETLTYDFEGSMQGWTTIDADADGYNWMLASAGMGTGYGHNGSDDMVLSQSYNNSVGALTPDNYLVSPQVALGGSLTFWACAQDASWASEHFGVAVSTTNNSNASAFTTIQEWTMTAKGSGAPTAVTRSGNREQGNWYQYTVDLSAYSGNGYVAIRHFNSTDWFYLDVDDVTIVEGGSTPTPPGPNPPGPTPPGPTPGPTPASYSAGPVIENLPVSAGVYYLVASSTTPDFEVTINAENMPCPLVDDFAFNPVPADDEDGVDPASVTLMWSIPEYATGWRLIFGTTYHPEANHPLTIMYPEDGSFTSTMSNSYTVRNLWNNTNYFWRVEFNNGSCAEGVSSPVWGFTTHLNVPQNLTVVDETVFNDEAIVLNWNAVVDRTYRQYNVYRDGELIGHTTMNNISNTTYTDGPLAYNMSGYTYYVTAVYDEGESAPSNTVNVKVSGRGNVDGHVYEQDGETGIAGAAVTMVGQDEFGVSHTYNFQTNGQGYYSGAVYAGSYNGSAVCNGYQGAIAPVQGNPIGIVYDETTSPIDYMMDENFDGPCSVIAQYYPDSLDPLAPYVKVYWGCGLPGEEIIEPFETGDFSLFDWQIDPTYPWSITTVNPYEGTYCMKSGGAGVANVVSNMTVTVNIPADGEMSFFGKISCESSWDYGYFYIDGTQMGSYTGNGSWGEKKFNVTAGDHTFQWRYTKDGSVNSYDDCFYVDYITFYKRPEPAGPGWHTYLESDFDNAYRSNVGDPSWGYEYPTSVLAQYAGFNLTKVAVFSDAMYSAVGGNFTCNVYKGGSTPASGTLAASITVDVPVGLDQWCEYDLNNAVNVTGNEPIYVLWTVNTYGGLGYPAGCASHASQYGDWWDPGDGSGWTHMGSCTWTMKNYFTNRAGRTVVLGTAEMAHAPMTEVQGARMDSHLRTFAKGETMTEAECVNPNAQIVPMTSNNTRAFAYYRIYRTDCYNDGPYTEENTLLLASEVTDTVYIDVDWPDAAPGVYKWGVGCVYSGNRGELYESPITWGAPMNNRATLTYDFDDSSMQGWTTIDADGDGYNWMTGSELMGTGYGHNGSNDLVLSQSYDNTYGVLYPDNYLVSPQVALGGSISFWACAQDNGYAAEHFGVAVSTTSNTSASAFTTIQEWTMTAKGVGAPTNHTRSGNRAQGNWYQYTVDLSAFSGNGYVAIRHFNCSDWFYLDVDDITIIEGAGGPTPPTPPTPGTGGDLQEERESEIVWSNCLEKGMFLGAGDVDITVLLNSADSPEGVTVTFTNYSEVEQELYPVAPVVLDGTGYYAWDQFRKGNYELTIEFDGYYSITDSLGIWDPTSLRYVMTEIIYGVSDLYVSRTGWAMWEGQGPVGPGPGPGPQPGNGSTFSVNFDDSQIPAGWITIDGGSPSGYGWQIGSTKLGSTGNGHNGSTDLILSQSYDNNYGVVYPDNWLISPAVTLANGSTFSLWACGQDASYAAEHFGVFVSTSGTNPSDFQMVQEWTLTAKGDRYDGVRGDRAQGTWYQKTVDLSAYAGEGRYIAVRHFNCSDMFYLDVDDLELTSGAKGNRAPWDLMATFNAAEAAQYGVASDGQNIYTCNWGYSSATWNFYKYDLQGNMIEGFNVSGCGTIRDLTYDGQYFYGGANSSVLYCIDLANKQLISSTSTTCSGIRHCSYDPVNDGFWVGGWSDLKLIDRTGATLTNGPAVESVSGTGYYEDEDGNPHLYLFTQAASDAKVYDYNILTNTVGAMLKDFSTTPGFDGGSSGGAFIGEYNGKIAFFGDVQQSPNLIGIYELADAGTPGPGPGPGPTPSGDILGAMIFVDGEWEAFVPVPTNSYTYEGDGNEVCVRIVYNGTADLPSNNFYYAMSCEECEEIAPGCAPGAPIHAEALGATDQVKVWWGDQNPGPGPGGCEGDEFTVNFESGIPAGWTTIDADGDGYNWNLASTTMGTGYGHNGSSDMIFSQSYDNNFGALTPDNYLVTPAVTLCEGSTFSFWACAQDASWASEHFGVAISDDGVNFGMVQEWTMTAKGEGKAGGVSRSGRAQGNWYQYTVNLGDYAGEGRYIAIRHFNCTDWFYLDVDDIELSNGAKSRDGIVKYNVYRSTDNAAYTMIGEVAAVAGQSYYEYIDTPASTGTYYYQVRADYGYCESEPAQAADDPNHNYVTATVDAIGENVGEVALFPNPTTGNVTIQANGMSRITVVSVLGQVVYDTEVNANEVILNMGQFNAGMYMVRVYTESGVTVTRVTVM